jgi:threonine/homoserine/homoserine lactone efflux protein
MACGFGVSNRSGGVLMFPIEIWLAYSAACLLLVLSPGPDNLLAIGRGLSQGKRAAMVSGISSGTGILFHVAAATCGLTLLMQTSALAFWAVKLTGAAYLLWLGIKVLRSRNLISFAPAARQPLSTIFATGFLSAALNPKPGLFVLAFIPQFVSPARGSVTIQMLVYGGWFAFLTAVGFALMGVFSSRLSTWLRQKPRVVAGLNVGAGVAFVASGLSVAVLRQK